MWKFIGNLASWEKVYDREDGSHIHNGVSLELIDSLLHEQLSDQRESFWATKYFETIIGKNACIETTEKDENDIFYAIRYGRKWYTRFIQNREMEVSNQLTALLQRNKDGTYSLLTAFVWPIPEAEPTDTTISFSEEHLKKAIDFWSRHALIPKNEPYDPKTETTEIPEIYSLKK